LEELSAELFSVALVQLLAECLYPVLALGLEVQSAVLSGAWLDKQSAVCLIQTVIVEEAEGNFDDYLSTRSRLADITLAAAA
jgi:hypothetical protein